MVIVRLPHPGGDDGNWGVILNNFLLQSHQPDGKLKINTVTATQLAAGAVVTPAIADGNVTESKLHADVQAKLNAIASTPGPDGADGREIELQASLTHIQWRYSGDSGWTNLVALGDITGPVGATGEKGDQGDPGDPATNLVSSVNGHTGVVVVTKSDVGLGAVPNLDTGAAVAQAHTHSNTSILDAMTASFTSGQETKLSAIAAGATANATDAELRNRATHTGTQAIASVDGLQPALDTKAARSLVPRVVNHGTNGSLSRPSGYATIIWIGSAEPQNQAVGDMWNEV